MKILRETEGIQTTSKIERELMLLVVEQSKVKVFSLKLKRHNYGIYWGTPNVPKMNNPRFSSDYILNIF